MRFNVAEQDTLQSRAMRLAQVAKDVPIEIIQELLNTEISFEGAKEVLKKLVSVKASLTDAQRKELDVGRVERKNCLESLLGADTVSKLCGGRRIGCRKVSEFMVG